MSSTAPAGMASPAYGGPHLPIEPWDGNLQLNQDRQRVVAGALARRAPGQGKWPIMIRNGENAGAGGTDEAGLMGGRGGGFSRRAVFVGGRGLGVGGIGKGHALNPVTPKSRIASSSWQKKNT